MARIQPGYGTKAYYINNGQWTAPIANLASVTAVVLIGGQPYMLTAGHAFRDVDNNANIMLAPQPGVNNYVGNVQAPLVLPANQPLINWGEGRLGAQAPYAASTDRYHCAGDKLGSTFDAGIAVLNAGVAWNQNYSGGKVLANIDTTWPPRALLQDEKYYLGTTEVTGLVQRDHFGVNWPTWQRQNQGGTLDRVLITDDAGRGIKFRRLFVYFLY